MAKIDRALDKILLELRKKDQRAFYELTYMAMMNAPEFAVTCDVADKEEKLKSLQEMVDFFSSEERYEMCADLVKLMKRIEHGNKE